MTRLRSLHRPALAGTAAVLALATLVALPLLAQPGPGGGPGGPGGPAGDPQGVRGPGAFPLRALAEFLDLTEAQVEEARLLLQDLAADLRPLAEEARDLHQELVALLASESPDPAAVGALVLEIHGVRDEMKAARDELDAAFAALLTPEQLERWEILKEARRHFRGDGRHGRHGRGPGPGPGSSGQGARCIGCGA